jgi:hypothetical protein
MSPYPVLDAISGWRLAPDDPAPVASFAQAILTATVIDEITAAPPVIPPVATTTTTGLIPRATAGGIAGLVGRPFARYPTATSASGAAVQLMLAAPGYLPLSLTANLGPQPATYPGAFTPAALGTVALHRAPILFSGRVASHTTGPLAAATVTLDGIWATLADLVNPAPSPADVVALASPLYAARNATATVAQQNLAAAPPAEAKTLLAPGNVGDASVRLSDWQTLAAGSILALDPQDPARAEYVSVDAITPLGIGPAFPATIALTFPLARPHPRGSTAIRMIPAAAGAANTLSRPTQPGDVSLFPATMTGLDATMNAVVVSGGGGAADEIHAAGLVTGASDPAGYVRLPAIHRIAQLRLRTHHPSQPTDLLTEIMLPFGADTFTRDLIFP